MGSIDRMGNGRVCTLLMEAVCRLLRWQPNWVAAQKMKGKLAGGGALKKQTVVALARLLAIDLWRWRNVSTGFGFNDAPPLAANGSLPENVNYAMKSSFLLGEKRHEVTV